MKVFLLQALAMASALIVPFCACQEQESQAGSVAHGGIRFKDSNGTMTAYDLLQQNGFPAGLLPNNVLSYSLESNGRFVLHLSGRCDVTIPDEYPVRYEKKITGTLSYGSVSDLSGVSVKALFVWWELTKIYMDGSKVVFEIGLLSASYPASNFDESPDCGSSLNNPELLAAAAQ